MSDNKIDVKNNIPPVGYNPISEIRGAMFHHITVPFNGVPVWCYVTCLGMIQLKSCGDISCLYLPKEDEKNKEPDIYEIIKTKNAQEALVKITLVKPSFDEIIGMITETNFLISEKKEMLNKIFEEIKKAPSGKERKKLENRAEQIEFYLAFPLPDDAMGFLTAWALGVKITDIKKLSRDILLNAAIMSQHYGNNTTDHITGVFTDFQKNDINNYGLYLYNQFQEDKKIESNLKKSKYRWYGGKGRKKK